MIKRETGHWALFMNFFLYLYYFFYPHTDFFLIVCVICLPYSWALPNQRFLNQGNLNKYKYKNLKDNITLQGGKVRV